MRLNSPNNGGNNPTDCIFTPMKRIVFLLLSLNATLLIHGQTPNWAEDIAPILYTNCTGCHIKGGIAPFSLVGYKAATDYSIAVKSAVQKRSMPPWPANPEYQRYAHEKLLSNEEIQKIVDWSEGGMPEGNPANAPADPKTKNETSIVNPDLKLKMPDYLVKTVNDEYRCFVIPTGLNAEKYLTEIEVVPGNLSVVHHVLVFHDTSTYPLQLDNNDPNPGYLGFGGTGSESSKLIGVWVPGQDPFKMPQGMGIKLEKQGYIILQVHYPPLIDNITDSSKVYFKFSSTALREVFIAPALNHVAPSLQNGPLYVPANQTKSFKSKYTLPVDISVIAVAPHMHLLGQTIKAYGVNLAGDTTRFIDIPNWDFHWQRTYQFKTIIKTPKFMTLWAEASYDNTSQNVNNPNKPPKAVALGEGTSDEMLLVYFWYTTYQSGDEKIVIDGSTPKNVGLPLAQKKESRTYPNPTKDIVTIEPWDGDPQKVVCHIFSLSGQLIQKCEFQYLPEGGIKINLQNVPAGTWLLRVYDGRRLDLKTIVKSE